MSKFTKALEKIQGEREDQKPNGAEAKHGPAFPTAEESLQDNSSPWGRGITTVKNTTPDTRVVTLRFPESVISEQYRMLRTSLKATLQKENARVILVSSSINSEGKTVTAVNLAVSLAESGDAKVALVDADLRRGKVAEYLGFGSKRTGLSDLLSQDLNPKQVMLRNSFPNLYVLPRGPISAKPSDLVSSNRLQVLLAELKTHFDYVIVDAPPIMSVADAGMLGRFTDGVLFVIQTGRTPKSVVAHAHLLFKQAQVKLLGYVLTNVEYQTSDYRYYSYSYDRLPEGKSALKSRTRVHLTKAGWGFRNLEDKFNHWWDRRILKKLQRPEAAAQGNGKEGF